MLRWIFSVAVLAAMLASSSDVMAQRRAPLRNLARQIGVRWSPGYHWQNPGHDPSHYSPWSETNLSNQSWQQADGQIIDGQWTDGQIIQEGQLIQPANKPVDPSAPSTAPGPENSENSATHLLKRPTQQKNWNGRSQNTGYGIPSAGAIQQGNGFNATSQENLQINRYLKPYHTAPSSTPIRIPNGGGQFQPTGNQSQIAPSQIPSDNIGWSSRYHQQFKQPYTQGK